MGKNAFALLALALAGLTSSQAPGQELKPQAGLEPGEVKAGVAIASYTFVAHATRKLTTEEVVAIARSAEPLRFDAVSLPGLELLSGREAIAKICGSEQPGYWPLVEELNSGLQVKLDEPLGDAAYSVTWPACLHIDIEGETRLVQPGDVAVGIGSEISGRRSPQANLQLLGLKRVSDLVAGETIKLPFVARPTELTPRAGKEQQLLKVLESAANVRRATDSAGEIILPVEEDVLASAGETDCLPGDPATYPYSAPGVAKAYEITRTQWSESNAERPVFVVVADNGFFGVPCMEGVCPAKQAGELVFARDRFPRWFFADSYYGRDGLGPVPVAAPNLHPLNYNIIGLRPNGVSGHGTHVAGLVLGGPNFLPYRQALSASADANDFAREGRPPWFKLVIFNLSGGVREIRPGALDLLFSETKPINARRIYNLSLIVGTTGQPNVAQVLQSLMRSPEHGDALFVAAAGNRLGNINSRELYPATLENVDNLIVIGAVDGSGALASFSNFSRNHVDMAAPGCKIVSWIDGESMPVAQSGTSQAAPLVTFASALLRSVWDKPPSDVKTRLIASGTMLLDTASRPKMRFPVQLSIPRALLVNHHVLAFRRDGVDRVLVGTMQDLQGFKCDEPGEIGNATDIRAYKTQGQSGLVFYRRGPSSPLRSCSGTLKRVFGQTPNIVRFDAAYELENEVPVERPGTWDIAAEEITDLVYPN